MMDIIYTAYIVANVMAKLNVPMVTRTRHMKLKKIDVQKRSCEELINSAILIGFGVFLLSIEK